ncbi:MAG TPA: hypothetical protein VHM70_30215 [Polyangiaceae bacterium]|nr:hypothetical protein [Polyangiaceae bacterium]
MRPGVLHSVWALVLSGCVGAAVAPNTKAENPGPVSLKNERLRHHRAPLVAPPPAFGNRVVLAPTRVGPSEQAQQTLASDRASAETSPETQASSGCRLSL